MQDSNHVSTVYNSNNKCEFISHGDPLLKTDTGKASNSSLSQGYDWARKSN